MSFFGTIYARPQGKARVVFRPPSLVGNLYDVTIANVDNMGTGQYIQVNPNGLNIFLVDSSGNMTVVDYIQDGVVDFSQLYFLEPVDITLFINNRPAGVLRPPAILTGYRSDQVYTGGPITVDPRFVFDDNNFEATNTALETVYFFPNIVLPVVDPPQIYFQNTNIVINNLFNIFATSTATHLSASQLDTFLNALIQTVNVQGIVNMASGAITAYFILFDYAIFTYTESTETGLPISTLALATYQFAYQYTGQNPATDAPMVLITSVPSLPPPVDQVTQNCRCCFQSFEKLSHKRKHCHYRKHCHHRKH